MKKKLLSSLITIVLIMSFAFSTSSSNATIPLSIETLDNEMGVSEKISV